VPDPSPPAAPRVLIGAHPDPVLADAVRRGGGEVVDDARDADAIVWRGDPPALRELLHPGIAWVQLSSAGVDRWLDAGAIDDDRLWTSGADAYSDAVAEHALALLLAGRRRLAESARARRWRKDLEGRPLRGATVAIVGAGGIGRALIGLIAPLGVEVLAVTRRGAPVDGAARTLPADRVAEAWSAADAIVLAAPATAETRHLVDAAALDAMRGDALLVNVARGSLVDTDALVRALAQRRIGAAALDVTEPEPLPEGHPLWDEPRALITPHTANPDAALLPRLAERVRENVARRRAGQPLLGVVELARGY
jgi:phosphoglycerate dehydrogenase-like enzyme